MPGQTKEPSAVTDGDHPHRRRAPGTAARARAALAFAFLLAAPALAAKTLLLPVEAIEDSQYLSAADFKLLYPGIDISGQLPDEEGWYVVYRHENLTYFFGPLANQFVADPHKRELEGIHSRAAAKRESLNTAEISLFELDFAKPPQGGGSPGASQGQPAGGGSPNRTDGSGEKDREKDPNAAAPDPGAGKPPAGDPGSGDPSAQPPNPAQSPPNRPSPPWPSTPTPPRPRTISVLDVLFRILGF